jgi:hypothetical protein
MYEVREAMSTIDCQTVLEAWRDIVISRGCNAKTSELERRLPTLGIFSMPFAANAKLITQQGIENINRVGKDAI